MCFNADLQIIFRDIEKELFPCLRRFGIAFYAYNPVSIAWQELQQRHQPIDPKEWRKKKLNLDIGNKREWMLLESCFTQRMKLLFLFIYFFFCSWQVDYWRENIATRTEIAVTFNMVAMQARASGLTCKLAYKFTANISRSFFRIFSEYFPRVN